jgi:endonuclease YncB( thermonuclease family)
MPMLCVAGTFRIVGTEPDGDSVRFVATDPAHWELVPGPDRVRVNAHGGAQLRLDGIDALETHYAPTGGPRLHQPLKLAHDAAAELLRWLGFRGVVRDAEKVVEVRADDLPGYLLTRTADEYGRCVALVGRGAPPAASGSSVMVRVTHLRKTANHRLIGTGLAYPTYYTKLYAELRGELTKQAAAARKGAGKGVWPEDLTQSGVTVADRGTLTDDAVILPKLFRRLVDYLQLNGDDPSLAGFAGYLAARDDRLYVIPTAEKTGLDAIVTVDGQTVKLRYRPEELVFDEA